MITVAGDVDVGTAVPAGAEALVVDDGGALGEALVRLLARHRQRPHRVHVDDLPRGISRHRPATVLLVASARDGCHEAALTWLRRHVPDVRVVVLGDGAPDTGDGVRRVSLDARPQALLSAMDGGTSAAARRNGASERAPRGALVDLTARELDVLRLVMAGRSSPAMADDLGISPHTVRTHVQNIMGKLGVRTRLQAAAVAHRAGLRPTDAGGGARRPSGVARGSRP